MDPKRVFIGCNLLHGLGLGLTCTGAYIPFMLKLGLELADIQRMNAIFFLTTFLLEVPTGALADGRSRRWSVTAGYLCWGLGALCFSRANGFWSACSGEAICGIGVAFISGAFDAWLRDSLTNQGRLGEYLPTKLYTQGFNSLGMIVGGIAGNAISIQHPRLAWITAAMLMAAAALFARLNMDSHGEVETKKRLTPQQAIEQSVNALRENQNLRWVAWASIAYGLVLPFNHYWAPFFTLRWEEKRLDFVWLLIQISIGAIAITARLNWWKNLPPLSAVALSLIVCGGSLSLTGYAGGLLGPLIWTTIHEMSRGLYKPQAENAIHAVVSSEFRATAGSLQSTIQTLGWAGILLIMSFGMNGQKTTDDIIGKSWILCGILLTMSGFGLYLTRPHIAEPAQEKP